MQPKIILLSLFCILLLTLLPYSPLVNSTTIPPPTSISSPLYTIRATRAIKQISEITTTNYLTTPTTSLHFPTKKTNAPNLHIILSLIDEYGIDHFTHLLPRIYQINGKETIDELVNNLYNSQLHHKTEIIDNYLIQLYKLDNQERFTAGDLQGLFCFFVILIQVAALFFLSIINIIHHILTVDCTMTSECTCGYCTESCIKNQELYYRPLD